MEIFPAIDLKGGQVVRLLQGDYDKVTVYNSEPTLIARQFADAGCGNLHIIDLDGAREGTTTNLDKIRDIVAGGRVFVQVGGGIRDRAAVETYLSLGVGRVILGTVAVEDFDFTKQMVAEYGEKISVSVDSREGRVATRGWLEESTLDAVQFCKKLESAGVSTIIFTDITRDGALKGVNSELYRTLKAQVGCKIIAAGGVSGSEDISALRNTGIYGAVIGKALYEGRLTLAEALGKAR